MAISTFDELQSALDNWLIKEYGSDRLGEFIALGEAALNRALRIRDMEQSADLSITTAQTVSLPTRFLGSRRLYLSVDPIKRLKYMPPIDFWSKWLTSQTGPPDAYTIEGDDIVLGPTPDTTYTGKLLYWQGFPALSVSQTTNDLLTNHPDAYLAASLLWAMTYKEDDEGIAKWARILNEIISGIQMSNEKDRYPAGDLIQRTDTGNPPLSR